METKCNTWVLIGSSIEKIKINKKSYEWHFEDSRENVNMGGILDNIPSFIPLFFRTEIISMPLTLFSLKLCV